MSGSGRYGLAVMVLAVLFASGRDASAQQKTGPAKGGAPTARVDVAAAIGWFNQEPGGINCCQWYNQSVWLGAEAGVYWTEHVKTEFGAAKTSEGRSHYYSDILRSAGTEYVAYGDVAVRTTRVTAMQIYQFGHNAWVHPFVGAGLHIARERRNETRVEYPVGPLGGPQTIRTLSATDTVVRGALTTGIKGYLSRRAFIRTDVTVGFHDRVDEVIARVGVGVDF